MPRSVLECVSVRTLFSALHWRKLNWGGGGGVFWVEWHKTEPKVTTLTNTGLSDMMFFKTLSKMDCNLVRLSCHQTRFSLFVSLS